ncbi:MAG: hypothetical protein JWQ59_987, partial [Cryobacterium sp.]|nr:hypothetical protein [Cryobacterium sp.]
TTATKAREGQMNQVFVVVSVFFLFFLFSFLFFFFASLRRHHGNSGSAYGSSEIGAGMHHGARQVRAGSA